MIDAITRQRILTGDCLELLAETAPASVDAIVTDPPFGIGKAYANGTENASASGAYWQWLEPRYRLMLRALKPGGFLAIWQSQVYFRHFWNWFGSDIHIYVAAKNFVQIRPGSPIAAAYDPIVARYVGSPPLRPSKPKRNMDYFVANTAALVSDPTRTERQHPYPRPLDQVLVLLENFVVEGGVILDPFLGSGTTTIAAACTGRTCIGMEIDPGYALLAKRRLAFDLDESLLP